MSEYDNEYHVDVEECHEEIGYVQSLLQDFEKLEEKFWEEMTNLWENKFSEVSNDVNHSIHIDTNNMNCRKRFMALMKYSKYYRKLMKFRLKLNARLEELNQELKGYKTKHN